MGSEATEMVSVINPRQRVDWDVHLPPLLGTEFLVVGLAM